MLAIVCGTHVTPLRVHAGPVTRVTATLTQQGIVQQLRRHAPSLAKPTPRDTSLTRSASPDSNAKQTRLDDTAMRLRAALVAPALVVLAACSTGSNEPSEPEALSGMQEYTSAEQIADDLAARGHECRYEKRQEVVASLRESGLSIRAIAAATGASDQTVQRDLSRRSESLQLDPAPITGTDGKTYKPKPTYLGCCTVPTRRLHLSD